MSRRVLKFGGSSLADGACIERVAPLAAPAPLAIPDPGAFLAALEGGCADLEARARAAG